MWSTIIQKVWIVCYGLPRWHTTSIVDFTQDESTIIDSTDVPSIWGFSSGVFVKDPGNSMMKIVNIAIQLIRMMTIAIAAVVVASFVIGITFVYTYIRT